MLLEPAITIRAAHDDGPGNAPINRIVIHLTSGSTAFPGAALDGAALGTARYFANPSCGGSAHYVHDAGPNEQHCVPDQFIAWHAPPNAHSIGQEICGHPAWTREQFLDARVRPALEHSAARTAGLCDVWGVPKVHIDAGQLLAGARGVTGHDSVSQAWHQSTHWDPGPNFPWDVYMALVNGGITPPPSPPPPRTPPVFQWPFGSQYVGDIAGPAASHGGYFAWERDEIKIVQQWLVFLNCVPGVASASWPWTSWCDGYFQRPYSTDAAIRFHQRFYPGQPYMDRIYLDDYNVLIRSRP